LTNLSSFDICWERGIGIRVTIAAPQTVGDPPPRDSRCLTRNAEREKSIAFWVKKPDAREPGISKIRGENGQLRAMPRISGVCSFKMCEDPISRKYLKCPLHDSQYRLYFQIFQSNPGK
jgi:hypothetical protein